MKKIFIISLILALSGLAFGARKALVIGNARYVDKPLKNPVNDAELMSSTLKNLRFSVTKYTDVNRESFNNAVRKFAEKLDIEDEVVFYYSGHGVQLAGENFLLPVEEAFEDESDIENKAISLNWITAKLNSTAITMIFLDACRDNPYSMYRSGAKGLAMTGATGNMFFMYSTEAGAVANDGKGSNSDFTRSLSSQMAKPGVSLDDISTNVTAEVCELSNNSQRPWKIGSLSFKYYFVEPDGGVNPSPKTYDTTSVYGSRYPSTVEERLKKNIGQEATYNPKLSKYFTVLSASEFLVENSNITDGSRGQFVSRNTIGMKVPFFGVEAYINSVKTWQNSDFSSGHNLAQLGAGAGFPNPESIRLFAYVVQNKLSSFAPYENYGGFKGQFAKRFRSEKQFTELGVDYEYNKVPDNFNPDGENPVSSYFEASYLDWTPNTRLSAYILASSLSNRYLEPNSFRGLAPASSPMLLANSQGNILVGRLVMENRETNLVDTRHVTMDAILALNFSKVIGMDFGGRYIKDNDWKNEQNCTSTDFSAGLRIGFLNKESIRLIGSAEYLKCKTEESTENLQFTGHAILKLTHHFALIGFIKHRSLWMREEGMFKLDPQNYYFGTSITARL